MNLESRDNTIEIPGSRLRAPRNDGIEKHDSSGEVRMHVPTITAGYLAILALLYAVLALQVILLRQGNRAALGDADNINLRSATRVPGNCNEYVPIVPLMVGVLYTSET